MSHCPPDLDIFSAYSYSASARNYVLTVILLVAVIAQFVLTTAYCGQIYKFTLLTQLSETIHFELAMNSTAAVTDTLLAACMMWLLRRSRSGIHRTDSLLNRLVVYTVGSGFVIAFWAIVALIGAAVAPHSLIYLSADLCFPKRMHLFEISCYMTDLEIPVYFNCMMALFVIRFSAF